MKMRLPLALLALVPVFACGELSEAVRDTIGAEGREDAQQAAASTQAGTLEAALLATLTATIPLDVPETDMAIAARTAGLAAFGPADCAQIVQTGAAITMTFTDCNGPYGISGVSGVANLTFAVEALNSVAVVFTATGLSLNGLTLTVNLSGEVAERDSARTWQLVSSSAANAGNGEVLARAGSFTMTRADDCVVIDGGWTTSIGTRNWATALSGLSRCGDVCPDAGTVVVTGGDADVEGSASAVTVTFNGTNDASWASSAGGLGQISLVCEGE